jgi:hypothetical membrane protein
MSSSLVNIVCILLALIGIYISGVQPPCGHGQQSTIMHLLLLLAAAAAAAVIIHAGAAG